MLRALCCNFPSLKWLFVAIGYLMLFVGGEVWFLCFPLTAYTLYATNEFPLAYFGVLTTGDVAVDFWLPSDMRKPVGGICVAFTLYGLVTLYINVRKMRDLRRGVQPKSRFADADAAMGIAPGFDKRDGNR
jgi:hypothetical protein